MLKNEVFFDYTRRNVDFSDFFEYILIMEDKYYKREEYLEKIKPYLGKKIIKVIIGMRRSGKSYFLKQLRDELFKEGLKKESFLMIDMEEIKNDFITSYKELVEYIDNYFKDIQGRRVLFIDEVQDIKGWEKALRSYVKEDYEIVITGSNAHLFSSEIATLLAGRSIEIEMYPLSFREYLGFTKEEDKVNGFKMYLKYGGMPVIYDFLMEGDKERYELLRSLYDSIILKEVISRHDIRDVHMLENLLKYIYDNIGNIFSAKKIVDYLKSQKLNKSVDTIINYLRYLEGAFAVYKAERYDIKGKRLLEVSEKYYVSDLGIRHALIGYKADDISGMLENVVYLELKKRGYRVHVGKYEDMEIDFIAERNGQLLYVQVCYLLETEKVIEREFDILLKIKDNFPKYVISLDEFFGDNRQGIKWMNIRDFLLSTDFS